jgi:hypothetical protein
MSAILKKRGWLKRVIEINDHEPPLLITYNGRGHGYESVSIQGDKHVENRKRSMIWFIPKFDLDYQDDHYTVEVKIWPWLAIKSVIVSKNGNVVYREGKTSL